MWRPCPHCGSKVFIVGRNVTVWQTVMVELTDDQGNYTELDSELHDQNDADPFTQAQCDACGREFDPERED